MLIECLILSDLCKAVFNVMLVFVQVTMSVYHMLWAWHFTSCIPRACSSQAPQIWTSAFPSFLAAVSPPWLKLSSWFGSSHRIDCCLLAGNMQRHLDSANLSCRMRASFCWLLSWYHAKYLLQNNILLLRHFSAHSLPWFGLSFSWFTRGVTEVQVNNISTCTKFCCNWVYFANYLNIF